MAFAFEKLIVYQKAIDFADAACQLTRQFPRGYFFLADQFNRASKLGVTKINIDTDGRLVWTRVHREFFLEQPEKFDLRGPGKIFMAEYANFIAAKNEKLGSAGQLETIRESLAAG